MDEDEALDKIFKITNTPKMSLIDRGKIEALMKWLPEEKRCWIEEGLFLKETRHPTDHEENARNGKDN